MLRDPAHTKPGGQAVAFKGWQRCKPSSPPPLVLPLVPLPVLLLGSLGRVAKASQFQRKRS